MTRRLCESCRRVAATHRATWTDGTYLLCAPCAATARSYGATVTVIGAP